MKILLVGTGGVGEAIARIAKDQPWVEKILLTDYSRERIKEVQNKLGDPKCFPIEWIDASKREMIEKLAI
jgi:predicted dinucleotide-utilizing enzyme